MKILNPFFSLRLWTGAGIISVLISVAACDLGCNSLSVTGVNVTCVCEKIRLVFATKVSSFGSLGTWLVGFFDDL